MFTYDCGYELEARTSPVLANARNGWGERVSEATCKIIFILDETQLDLEVQKE